MGPWNHGGWGGRSRRLGSVDFGSETGTYFKQEIQAPFFACQLKNKCTKQTPEASIFQSGSNKWMPYDAWPPKEATARTIYLNTGNRLTWEPPTEASSFDSYVSDPKKAVPYTTATSFGYYRQYPIDDQRFAATRPDVVVFQTEALTAPLTIAGPIKVSLRASTSGTDADYIVKVIDVYPDDTPDSASAVPGVRLGGYQQLVKGDVMRARWRKGYEKPIPMVPNEPTTIEFALQDVFHTLQPGHKLMVQVQSTWFPLIDRNPQTFVPNIFLAPDSLFKPATHKVYRSAGKATFVEIPVVKPVPPIP
jgi:putative CocE/NonD family hydrolase